MVNWDQTACKYIQCGDGPWMKLDQKNVPTGLDDKREITALIAGAADGTFLQPQLIYGGKTDRSHLSFIMIGTHFITRIIGLMKPPCWNIWQRLLNLDKEKTAHELRLHDDLYCSMFSEATVLKDVKNGLPAIMLSM